MLYDDSLYNVLGIDCLWLLLPNHFFSYKYSFLDVYGDRRIIMCLVPFKLLLDEIYNVLLAMHFFQVCFSMEVEYFSGVECIWRS